MYVRMSHNSYFLANIIFLTMKIYQTIHPGSRVGDPVVNDLVAIQYLPAGNVQFKINFDDEWKELLTRPKNLLVGAVQQLYQSDLKIKSQQYDLQKRGASTQGCSSILKSCHE